MGWGNGAELLGEVWSVIRPYINDGGERRRIARKLKELFEYYDADTIEDECEQLMQDLKP